MKFVEVMDLELILRKTELGQEEIKSRKRNVEGDLRAALIVVNGVATVGQLHKTLSKMPAFKSAPFLMKTLKELIDQGYITSASERVTKIFSEYGSNRWTEAQSIKIKNKLLIVADEILGEQAKKVTKKLHNAPNTKEGIIVAVDESEKLMRLFFDEKKAKELATRYRSTIIESIQPT